MVTIHTLPATPERWDDVVTAFGRRVNNDDAGWCWCQRFIEPPIDGAAPTDNRDVLRQEIQSASVPPGVLAYVDESPAGWLMATPRVAVPLVKRNRALRRILDDDAGRVVDHLLCRTPAYRSIGVATALLDAAVALRARSRCHRSRGPSRRHRRLDGRPGERLALFTGTMRTFLAAGFHEIGRTYPSRPVMRRDL